MSENESAQPVALITGSGRKRLGNAIASGLADDGYRIAIHFHKSKDEAESFVEELTLRGIDAIAIQGDVSKAEDVKEMVQQVQAQFGRIDVLVNTASVWQEKDFDKVNEEDLQLHFDVDLKGTFLCSQQVGLVMTRQSGGGAIVTFSDWAISRPYPGHAAYFAVKGAIPTMTRCLARELAERNPKIRVNCIQPGPVMLPDDTSDGEKQALIDSTLVRQVDRPDSIVNAVRYLINDSFITGVCLPVDGGRSVFAADEVR